jgi:hypothetical protein
LQRTPLTYLGKSETVQGLNDVVDSFGRANEEDFDGFSVGDGFRGGWRGDGNGGRFTGIGDKFFSHGGSPDF